MKKLWIPALAGMMLWAAMTLTEAALERTPTLQAAQSTYRFTLIAVFAPPYPFNIAPSAFAEGPVITNDGTVVYSAGDGRGSTIFSSDGTVTRSLTGSIEHTFRPLETAVSGNGMMVTNLSPNIIDVHDGTVLGQLDPGDGFVVGSGIENFGQTSINNRGSVAFTGNIVDQCLIGNLNGGVFRFDGETTTTIAKFGLWAGLTVIAFPSINERGQVAFLVGGLQEMCPSTLGLQVGDLYVGDGTRIVKIAEAYTAPSLNNRGEVGFIGVNDGALSILVSDGTRTRVVADTNGPFADFPQYSPFLFIVRAGISINDRGDVAFMGALDNGDLGIFTGPDVLRDRVIATGDALAGSAVSNILLSRQSLNNNGQIAFHAWLADGRIVIVRAEPTKQLLN